MNHMQYEQYAPGHPGVSPRWNSSAKSGVGTALSGHSEICFTTSHGILNEIYYPRIDFASIRDMGFLVSDGKDFFSEEKRHTRCELSYLSEGVPAYRFVNHCTQGRYKIEKEIVVDPRRDALLQRVSFHALQGVLEDYHLYALMAPHIMNAGAGNTAWCGNYKGMPMLFAERNGAAVALACSVPFLRGSVGFVGISDAWQDVSKNKELTHCYQRAEKGNVAMCGEIDLSAVGEEGFIVTIGFGMNAHEAGQRALSSIMDGFESARERYIREWEQWQSRLHDLPSGRKASQNIYRVSAAVIISHEAQQFPGGFIASLSVPWGMSKGDDDLGGYHLVWPRDLVETAGGLLAAGTHEDAQRVLRYLKVTQEPDGHWLQNMWLDGSAYWNGIQLDETAFPVLLIGLMMQEKAFSTPQALAYLPMVRKAVTYILRYGPSSQQDRWEENSGYSPFTLAAEVAALLVAADLFEANGEGKQARYLRETADTWNGYIEAWTYVTDTPLARELGIEGYYIRISPLNVGETPELDDDLILIKNLPGELNAIAASVVSPDALALVRFGLRAPDDPRILNTIKAIDALLKIETPAGDCWHRYNHDGYGEHEDGSPFDGTGIGRAWPLLTGERAHYEIAAGNFERAEELFETMGLFANEGGMIPEQIWDTEDIPEKELYFGRPAGSAMPLVWAHGEYIKLCRSLRDKRVFDMPMQTRQRYLGKDRPAPFITWRFMQYLREVPHGRTFRIEVFAPAMVHWSADEWATPIDEQTMDSGLGTYYIDIPTGELSVGTSIRFTFYWPEARRWEGNDFEVVIVEKINEKAIE